MPVSSRTEERLMKDMATDVTELLTVALKAANVFSVALDESRDVNNNSHLEVVARHCRNSEVQ